MNYLYLLAWTSLEIQKMLQPLFRREVHRFCTIQAAIEARMVGSAE